MSRLIPRTRIWVVLAAVVLAVAMSFVTAAPADAHAWHKRHQVCYGGPIASGMYASLTVKGVCWTPNWANVKVKGNLTVAPGATLNGVAFTNNQLDLSHFNMARITVYGNVFVGHGAILGLGCTPAMALDPGFPFPLCSTKHNSHVVIKGSLIAHSPLTMYLDGIRVRGHLISTGGGPGPSVTQDNPAFNFAVKDNTVGKNLVLAGWSGGWSGSVRNQVHGNLLYLGMKGVDPDTNEIITNVVGHNLVCWGNDPATQYGDAMFVPGAAPNVVGGHAIGQCHALTEPFPSP